MDLSEKKSAECQLPRFDEIAIKCSARRKRIGIRLKSDGTVELLAPEKVALTRLQSAYKSFEPWLAKQLEKLAAVPEAERPHNFEFKPGGTFFFCGKKYVLKCIPEGSSRIIALRDDSLLTPNDDPQEIKHMLEAFYRRHARRIITAKFEELAGKYGFGCRKININGAKRRFGSCNSRKELNFSWYLAMYPMELIELVILHECSHFREMNHSPAFYRVLAEYLPDHRQRSKELDKWSRKLSNYDSCSLA
ncbi:MAG: M48 family metallopeptidase [Lentisphaeria bacterium]|nr:M48 family metallopeptidase [Lentisphaeria bacterium]